MNQDQVLNTLVDRPEVSLELLRDVTVTCEETIFDINTTWIVWAIVRGCHSVMSTLGRAFR